MPFKNIEDRKKNQKEYYEENKQIILEKAKEYKENNKNIIKEKKKNSFSFFHVKS